MPYYQYFSAFFRSSSGSLLGFLASESCETGRAELFRLVLPKTGPGISGGGVVRPLVGSRYRFCRLRILEPVSLLLGFLGECSQLFTANCVRVIAVRGALVGWEPSIVGWDGGSGIGMMTGFKNDT
jgi:hypothetical protein